MTKPGFSIQGSFYVRKIFCYGCMFAFVVFVLVLQEIGWEERL